MTMNLFNWAHPITKRKRVVRASERSGKAPAEERWATFKTANPHVIEEALRLARVRLAKGETKISAKGLWEDLRESLKVKKLGTYKLNNDFTSIIARDLIKLEPRLEGVIELRERKSAMERACEEAPVLRKDPTDVKVLHHIDLMNNYYLLVQETAGVTGVVEAHVVSASPLAFGRRDHPIVTAFGTNAEEARQKLAGMLSDLADRVLPE